MLAPLWMVASPSADTSMVRIVMAANASGAAMNAMLKGQMLATALDVYFSSPALGGNKLNAPTPIGGLEDVLLDVRSRRDLRR